MAPRGCAKVPSIVVGISRPREAVIGHMVPFFARDFASLAANANTRVSKEADLYFFLYEIVMALVSAFRAFADHSLCAPSWCGLGSVGISRAVRGAIAGKNFLLILFLLLRDPRRWPVHLLVLRDAESSGLLVGRIY